MCIGISLAYGENNCFIAKEDGKIIKQIGKCKSSYSPFSTFKIPLAVIGFDAGVISSSDNPNIKFSSEIEKKYVTYYNPQLYPVMLFWKKDQTPKSWMRDSVVWYSRYITHNLGAEKLQQYVTKLNYGNKDLSGNLEKNDGLMNSWLGSSLKISPIEQAEFMEKLSNLSLPMTKEAQEKTIEIIKMEAIYDDWQLYGKTGGGKSFGWFVGWVEKNNKRIVFAQSIEQSEDSLVSGGRMAKEVAKDNLINLIIK